MPCSEEAPKRACGLLDVAGASAFPRIPRTLPDLIVMKLTERVAECWLFGGSRLHRGHELVVHQLTACRITGSP